ncbi:hypothetical protein BIV57_00170 [Mangrovactinospora gilvigrisea]|uniref:Uncharacterized protein n=1 Tax=Mangrovactinospora gilvigrisea TaxID=1428644 RepID=A0A1J7CCN6_9ACTN|nr:hypothetical protein [Mangrovactinospora gilvigrisea]OIV39304.1 hypothetical protein BIV57_00170 [Mangrovactinospora gilvigrisea]
MSLDGCREPVRRAEQLLAEVRHATGTRHHPDDAWPESAVVDVHHADLIDQQPFHRYVRIERMRP